MYHNVRFGARSSTAKPMVGRTLSHYEVSARLGAGAVGVVYKARDSRLGRLVALKCILPELVAEPEIRRRFEREAKAAARIEHPNVCTIYEIGRDGATEFLAEAFVDGPSLAEAIKAGPLKIEQALDIAQQVASGLQAAHECGVVHRDVKPGNILLSQGNEVKLTDFGLAQITDASRLTTEGTVLGTPAYMSPEQIWGEEADARADIWALGVCIYEMLTGKLPFPGDGVQVIRFSILNEEPQALRLLNAPTPAALERLIEKALRKDREERYQHADEMIADLKQVRRAVQASTAKPVQSQPPAKKQAQLRPALVLALSAITLACSVLGIWVGHRLSSGAAPIDSPSPRFLRVTESAGDYRDPTLSNDGRFVAYSSGGAGDSDIWLRRLSDGQTLRLTSSPGDEVEPSFSPDGSQIVFRSEGPNNGLFVVSTLGGAPLPLTPSGIEPRFHPTENRLVYWIRPKTGSHFGTVSTFEIDGAVQRLVDFGFPVAHPIWSPDGSSILAAGTASGDDVADWWVLAAEVRSTPRRLGLAEAAAEHKLDSPSQYECFQPAAWIPEGVVFVAVTEQSSSLWLAHVYDGESVKMLERLTSGPGDQADPGAGMGSDRSVAFVLDTQSRPGFSTEPPFNSVWLLQRYRSRR